MPLDLGVEAVSARPRHITTFPQHGLTDANTTSLLNGFPWCRVCLLGVCCPPMSDPAFARATLCSVCTQYAVV